MDGITRRLSQISKNSRFLIVPMDHGASQGPIAGIENMDLIVEQVSKGGASAIVAHKGVLKQLLLSSLGSCGVIMHLSASTQFSLMPNYKVLVGTVEEAIALGADAVSTHINIGGEDTEPVMIQEAGKVADACRQYGIPLLIMAYARGPSVPDSLDADNIAFVARVAYELGADVVKCNYSGDVESFRKVTQGCAVPIVIAGGPKIDNDLELLKMAAGAIEAGAAGISIGRNVFQHFSPRRMVEALGQIIYEDKKVEEALNFLQNF